MSPLGGINHSLYTALGRPGFSVDAVNVPLWNINLTQRFSIPSLRVERLARRDSTVENNTQLLISDVANLFMTDLLQCNGSWCGAIIFKCIHLTAPWRCAGSIRGTRRHWDDGSTCNQLKTIPQMWYRDSFILYPCTRVLTYALRFQPRFVRIFAAQFSGIYRKSNEK